MGHSSKALGVVVVALTVACSPDEPVGTEHLLLHATDTPVCAGTLADADADVERIADAFGLEPVARIGLYYGASAVAERCIEGASGCASQWDDEVWIAADDRLSLAHELVHAVRRQHRLDGPRVFEEGLAQVLRGRDDLWAGSALEVNLPRPGPAELVMLAADEYYALDSLYIFAGSIVEWMLSAFDQDAVFALTVDPAFQESMSSAEVVTVLPEYLGVDLMELDARYQDEAAWDWDVGTRCPGATTEPLGDGRQWVGMLDCDDLDTLGAQTDRDGAHYMLSRSWCFSIPQATTVRLRFDAAGGLLRMSPGDPDAGRGISVEADASMDVEVEAGSWQLRVYSDSLELLGWSVEVDPIP